MVCFRYVIVNTLHTGDKDDDDNDTTTTTTTNNNNNNNTNKSCICQDRECEGSGIIGCDGPTIWWVLHRRFGGTFTVSTLMVEEKA
jgi:hypothetical protein